jgi:energy-coupling factor transporter ATP-binding protein EcfA2
MNDASIHTEGGAVVDGEVRAGRDFVGRDRITINITWQAAPFTLEQEPDLAQLRADYLAYLRQAYQYLDFKGLPQVEKIAQQLPLDAIYVPLRARPEMPEGETWLRVAGRLWRDEEAAEIVTPEGRALSSEPVPADQALGQSPALVILGDPGAGKSTLLKVLALALARQTQGPLPILVPLNAYAAALEQGEISLHDFLLRYFATRQHCLKDLGSLFDAALEAGQAVVLLDGLDEVQANRRFLVRLVQDFAAEYIPEPKDGEAPVTGNRLAVTSRIVGYREAPLGGPRWRTYTLVDFGREEIERFAECWTLAFECAVLGDTELAGQAARRERDELLMAISANPGIERLASNPLLLTILALIKRQGVSLPRRRVELYELYLRTLINAWNKARSLDERPVGPEMDYLETVQVLAPLGLWLRETNPTAGLVSRSALENWLAEYYRREWEMAPGPACREARDFLKAVHSYSNLLVERGVDQYGFLHLTFEEMLAAKGIAAQAQLGPASAVETILRHLDDPNWHETILLAVGALGVVAQQPRAAGEVLRHLCQAELAGEALGQNVVTAGQALLDVGEMGVGRRAAVLVTGCLVETMHSAEVPPQARRQAGLILGQLGWQPDELDAFVEIAPGSFLYGDEKERRQISYRYWVATYPVTNAQYARFVEEGGYQRRELWSNEGWAWRRGDYDSKVTESWLRDWLARRPPQKRAQPFWWDDADWNNPIFPVVGVSWFEAEAYCNWLTE